MIKLFCLLFILSICKTASVLYELGENFLEYGKCANHGMVEEFQPEKFAGVWYTAKLVYNPYQASYLCIFSVSSSATTDEQKKALLTEESIAVTTFSKDEFGGLVNTSAVIYKQVMNDGGTRWKLRSHFAPDVSYDVVDTDYLSYACFYSCVEMVSVRGEVFGILTRETNPENDVIQTCLDRFTALELNTDLLLDVDQTPETCEEVYDTFPINISTKNLVNKHSLESFLNEKLQEFVTDFTNSQENLIVGADDKLELEDALNVQGNFLLEELLIDAVLEERDESELKDFQQENENSINNELRFIEENSYIIRSKAERASLMKNYEALLIITAWIVYYVSFSNVSVSVSLINIGVFN